MLSIPTAQAANSAIGTFTANIKVATCSVSMTSGKSLISLGRFDAGSLTAASINEPLLVSDEPQSLTTNCSGLPDASSTPTLTLTGDTAGTADDTVFRSSTLGSATSKSLGIRVQAQQIDGSAPWEGIDYMHNNGAFHVAAPGAIPNASLIPLRFSMWCKPVVGETFQNCKAAGTVAAGVTFSFDYK